MILPTTVAHRLGRGHYHVTVRGNERKAFLREDSDGCLFLHSEFGNCQSVIVEREPALRWFTGMNVLESLGQRL